MKTIPIFIAACLSGYLFSQFHLPLPWTLGPLVATLLWTALWKKPAYWPRSMRNLGLTILGYVMGSPFTPEIGQRIWGQLPFMFLTTLVTIGLCLVAGYVTGRLSGIGLANSMIGSMPGGLSQMSAICEETKGTNAGVVTLMQTVRVITVVFLVPFLSFHGLADTVHAVGNGALPLQAGNIMHLSLFALVIGFLVLVHRRFRIPSPYLLAPVVGTAALVLSGIHPPTLPPQLIALCQVFVGIRMGMDVGSTTIANWQKIVWLNLLSILVVIVGLLAVAFAFSLLTPVSLLTAFISTSPGGMSEMGLTAMMTDADLPTVVSYQLFRLLFVLIVAIPAIRWWLRKKIAYNNKDHNQ